MGKDVYNVLNKLDSTILEVEVKAFYTKSLLNQYKAELDEWED